jgi:hypothetical protein
MSPVGLGLENDYAGEPRQQLLCHRPDLSSEVQPTNQPATVYIN